MNRAYRLVAALLAAVLGATLLSGPAGASASGTITVGRAWAERTHLRFERLDEGTWRTVDWTQHPVVVGAETVDFHLPTGDYRVAWYRHPYPTFGSGFEDVSTTYFPSTESPDDASVLQVEPDSSVDLTSFVPRPGGHLTGLVSRADGSPLPRVAYVEAFQPRGDEGWVPVSRSDITPHGDYDLGGLDSGPTVVRVSGPSVTGVGYGAQGADAQTFSGGATSEDAAQRVDVFAGRITVADPIVMVPNGTLSGVVRTSDGVPLNGVRITSDAARAEVTTGPDGSWTLGGLREGTYGLSISDPLQRIEHARRDATVQPRRATDVRTDLAHRAPYWRVAPTLDVGPHAVAWDRPMTVDPGVLYQDDAVITGVRWYEGSGPGRVLLATGSSFTAPRTLDGSFVSAEVTAQRKGIESRVSSPAVEVRDPEYFTGRPTTSTNTPVAHELLTARTGTLSPTPSTTTWQWLRDGKAIKGATGNRYRPTASDVGRNVVAQATVQRPGYVRAVVRSTSRDVTSARSSVKATLTPRGGRRVAVSAKVTVAKVSAAYVDGSLDLYRSRKGSDRIGTIRVVDGRATTTLARQPRGKRTYWVRFRPSRDGMTTSQGARTSTRVR